MTKTSNLLFLLFLVLAACKAPAADLSLPDTTTVAPTTPTPLIQTTQSFTRTPRPSVTPRPSPTLTPTFDIASVITRTSAPSQECPVPANIPLPDLSKAANDVTWTFSPREEAALNYLNQGGDPDKLITELQRTWGIDGIFTNNNVIKDLTGDGVSEILIIQLAEVYIFGCKEGRYQLLMSRFSDSVTMNFYLFQLAGIQDMNLDGMPEIVIAEYGCGGMGAGQCLDVYVYEWDGNQFGSLIPEQDRFVGRASTYGSGDEYLPGVKLQDMDHNGTLELTLSGGIPSSWYDDYFYHAPWRIQRDTYHWNGHYFVPLKTEFSPPEYRYQAVQDGDRAMLRQEYDKSLAFYQAAIFSDKLLGWSPAHKERSKILYEFTWDFAETHKGTPEPAMPPDDPQEYPNLAAYARFRIMVLHLLEGHRPEAQIVYETLQEKFPEGQDGHAFALIAKAFWDEYQLSQSMEGSCSKATAMAEKHKEVLKFLGGDYHNFTQDIMYELQDICPFK